MYSNGVINKMNAMIAGEGLSGYAAEIFVIARGIGGGEAKLRLIGKVLSKLEGNIYRNSRGETVRGDYNTYTYTLERKTPRKNPTLILRRKYRWVRICSTTSQYWTYPLSFFSHNLTDTECKLLSLIKNIQNDCGIPLCEDGGPNTIVVQ
jgi:hypothetical protein